MMKRLYTLALAVGLAIGFMGYSSGPTAAVGGRTGAPGDLFLGSTPRTCVECHGTGFGPPTVTIEVQDSLGAAPVSAYLPGCMYTVVVTIQSNSGSPRGYGFQMIDIQKSNNTNPKGFAVSQSSGIQTAVWNNRTYAEQSTTSSDNTFKVKWRAPAVGVGAVVFYASGNAVNNTGGSEGDGANNTSFELPQLRTSARDIVAIKRVEAFPNPTTEGVVLTVESTESKQLRLRMSDVTGRTLYSDAWMLTAGENVRQLQLSDLPKGVYMVQLLDKEGVVTKKIFKN